MSLLCLSEILWLTLIIWNTVVRFCQTLFNYNESKAVFCQIPITFSIKGLNYKQLSKLFPYSNSNVLCGRFHCPCLSLAGKTFLLVIWSTNKMTTITFMLTEISMIQVVCAWNFCGHIMDDQGQLFQQIIVCWQCFLYFLLYMLKESRKRRLNGNVL